MNRLTCFMSSIEDFTFFLLQAVRQINDKWYGKNLPGIYVYQSFICFNI